MQISRAGDYALRAVVYLSRQPGERLSTIGEIARAQQIPQAFLAKLMPSLTRGQMVTSVQGPKGGYRLARPAGEISFYDVLHAIEGPMPLVACTEEGGCCEFEEFCTMNEVFGEAQRLLDVFFRKTTFADLPLRPAPPVSDKQLQAGLNQLAENRLNSETKLQKFS
ncbi:MAG: Rrf2 family transcriptional regulator [bacterium]|nr:Rrf2 family transcriptional regulator [bacterium]